MEVRATAPGKVFLLGEYAVALGAPAVVAAVDRRVGCRVRRSRGAGRLVIGAGTAAFEGPLSMTSVADVPRPVRFVAAAAAVSAQRLGLSDVDLAVHTWSDLDGAGPKSGLGGSAAVVAAVTTAVHRVGGRESADPHTLASCGVAAHRLAQGGGSGADVVVSTLGGVQRISGLDGSRPPTSVASCLEGVAFRSEALALPAGLTFELVATGESARTGPRIARFVERARGRGPLGAAGAAIAESWVAGSAAAVDGFCEACRDGDVPRAVAAAEAGRTLLTRLGAVAGVGVWTPNLRRACAALGSAPDVVIKPAGAGGGDSAVALVPEIRREDLRAAWRKAGLQPLEVEASLEGVKVEVVHEEGAHG